MPHYIQYCGRAFVRGGLENSDILRRPQMIGPSSIYNMTSLSTTNKKLWKMSQIFVAFSEHLNFKTISLEAKPRPVVLVEN